MKIIVYYRILFIKQKLKILFRNFNCKEQKDSIADLFLYQMMK